MEVRWISEGAVLLVPFCLVLEARPCGGLAKGSELRSLQIALTVVLAPRKSGKSIALSHMYCLGLI